MKIIFTEHAETRFNERTSIPVSYREKVASLALKNYEKHKNSNSMLRAYIEKKEKEKEGNRKLCYWGEFFYLFVIQDEIAVLLTVFKKDEKTMKCAIYNRYFKSKV